MNNPQLPARLRDYSLRDLQNWNNDVYAEINGREFELHEMVSRLSRYNSRVLLRIRHRETEKTGYYFSMMLSWLCAIANRLSLNLSTGLTTYCAGGLPAESPLAELQQEFKMRHSEAELLDSALCLTEKVQAVASALEYYRETHDRVHFLELARKMAQSLEALCVVAALLGFQLNEELERYFSNGCAKCRKIPCGCGFRADKVV